LALRKNSLGYVEEHRGWRKEGGGGRSVLTNLILGPLDRLGVKIPKRINPETSVRNGYVKRKCRGGEKDKT